jgi:hypothetical protein
MEEKQKLIEDALLQLIKDDRGGITGLKELAKEYNITIEELAEPIKRLSEKNIISVLETEDGVIKLFIKK